MVYSFWRTVPCSKCRRWRLSDSTDGHLDEVLCDVRRDGKYDYCFCCFIQHYGESIEPAVGLHKKVNIGLTFICGGQFSRCLDRKSTRLNSSHANISYA